MSLPDPMPIQPFTRPARAEVVVPGSKSLTNRALLLAALCENPVTLTGALFSDDTQVMAEALRQLGFSVAADTGAATIHVRDQAKAFRGGDVELFVGLAGTAARFLTALCAAAPHGVFRLDGVPQMRKRPMQPLIAALRAMGADLRCPGQEGFFPLVIQACGLRGGRVALDARESSQLLSALLMVAPLCREDVEIVLEGPVRRPFVDMTAELMAHFGQPGLTWINERQLRVPARGRYALPIGEYPIEPDATSASYFLALPLVTGGAMSVRGLMAAGGRSLQGDTEFAAVLEACGLSVRRQAGGVAAEFAGGTRRAVQRDFSAFSDTFLTLAAIAPLLEGPTRISGIAHTRKQETDRVTGMARELKRLGQEVLETEDVLEIRPRPLRDAQTVETYDDHRFAMSFAVLGCHDLRRNGTPWLAIRNPACCAKTFPRFFELLDTVRQKSLAP